MGKSAASGPRCTEAGAAPWAPQPAVVSLALSICSRCTWALREKTLSFKSASAVQSRTSSQHTVLA